MKSFFFLLPIFAACQMIHIQGAKRSSVSWKPALCLYVGKSLIEVLCLSPISRCHFPTYMATLCPYINTTLYMYIYIC